MNLPECIDPDATTNEVDRAIIERHAPAVRHRGAVEVAIVRQLLLALHDNGYEVQADDGEDEIKDTTIDGFVEHLFGTDEGTIFADKNGLTDWIALVFGNDGWDVISDYTAKFEHFMGPFSEWVEKQQAHDEARIAMREDQP